MTELGITTSSSRGQIVIPKDLWGDIKEGDRLVVIRNHKQLILKKADDFDENVEEDIEFARRTEEAYKRVESGEYLSVDSDDLQAEMSEW